MRKLLSVFLIGIFLMAFIACGQQKQSTEEIVQPAEVVARWFYSHTLHDEEMYQSTVVEQKRDVGYIFDSGLVSIKIYDITTASQEKSREKAEELIDGGSVSGIYGTIDANNVSFVRVHFDWETDGSVTPVGENTWSFILVRENAVSPWLIADWGVGNEPEYN